MLLFLCCSVVIMLYCHLGCSVIICVVVCIDLCTVSLPPCVNPIAVDKYINININISMFLLENVL